MSQIDKSFLQSYDCFMIQRTDSKQYYHVDDDIFTYWYKATEFTTYELASAVMEELVASGMVSSRAPLTVSPVRIEFHDSTIGVV
jgi:hypothetical protein